MRWLSLDKILALLQGLSLQKWEWVGENVKKGRKQGEKKKERKKKYNPQNQMQLKRGDQGLRQWIVRKIIVVVWVLGLPTCCKLSVPCMVLNVRKPLSGPPCSCCPCYSCTPWPLAKDKYVTKGWDISKLLTSCFPFFPEIFPCSGREELWIFRTFQMY